jgi:hypothetical protein
MFVLADGFASSLERGGPDVTIQLAAAAEVLQEEQIALEKSWDNLIT